MKKGEVSVFTIQPEYAYGENGAPPTIPPNATLTFEIELLSWASVKDICKDGGVFKKIVAEGEKWETPKDADEVTSKSSDLSVCIRVSARLPGNFRLQRLNFFLLSDV